LTVLFFFAIGTVSLAANTLTGSTTAMAQFPVASVSASITTIAMCYGPQSTVLTTTVSSGTAPFTYSWSTGATTASINVSPTETTTYKVAVTDANGRPSSAEITIVVVDACCGNSNNVKVLVCHNGHTICVSENAVPAHLAHGDIIGDCQNTRTSADVQVNNADAYPNPFDRSVNIKVDAPEGAAAMIEVKNMMGQTIAALYNGTMAGGEQTFTWTPEGVSNGIYFCQIIVNGEMKTIKLVYAGR
jgi:hypothetical protein